MKRFLLLQDHQEIGPFTLEELRLWGLKSDDLVWIEGQSTAWAYPGTLKDLESLQKAPENRYPSASLPFQDSASLPIAAETFPSHHNEEADQEGLPLTRPAMASGSIEKRASKSFLAVYGFWITALVSMLAATTWLMKEAADLFTGRNLSKSRITHVATPLRTLPEDVSPAKNDDATVQNAISREIVPVDTSEAKEPEKKKPKLKELKKYLQVESNDYKVGVFGGINDLRLTVVNNSAYELDKVVLQVDYLKPKGEPIETEKFTYFAIPAHGKKTLEIPPTKRGVKVKYRIVEVKSKEYKVALVQA